MEKSRLEPARPYVLEYTYRRSVGPVLGRFLGGPARRADRWGANSRRDACSSPRRSTTRRRARPLVSLVEVGHGGRRRRRGPGWRAARATSRCRDAVRLGAGEARRRRHARCSTPWTPARSTTMRTGHARAGALARRAGRRDPATSRASSRSGGVDERAGSQRSRRPCGSSTRSPRGDALALPRRARRGAPPRPPLPGCTQGLRSAARRVPDVRRALRRRGRRVRRRDGHHVLHRQRPVRGADDEAPLRLREHPARRRGHPAAPPHRTRPPTRRAWGCG